MVLTALVFTLLLTLLLGMNIFSLGLAGFSVDKATGSATKPRWRGDEQQDYHACACIEGASQVMQCTRVDKNGLPC
jgi:hypothetical protein